MYAYILYLYAGIVVDIPRRPVSEMSRRNRNVAFTYAYIRLINEFFPSEQEYNREGLILVRPYEVMTFNKCLMISKL